MLSVRAATTAAIVGLALIPALAKAQSPMQVVPAGSLSELPAG